MLIGGRLEDTAEGAAPTTWCAARCLLLFLLRSSCVKDVGHRTTTTSTTSTVVSFFLARVVLVDVACHVAGMLLGHVLFYGSKVLFNLSASQGAWLRHSQGRPIVTVLSERLLSLLKLFSTLVRTHEIWVCLSSIILLLDILDRLKAGKHAIILTLLSLLTGSCLLHHILNL